MIASMSQGRLLGQRTGRELLRHAQDGARQRLRRPRSRPRRARRVHRLLQPRALPLRARIRDSRCSRTQPQTRGASRMICPPLFRGNSRDSSTEAGTTASETMAGETTTETGETTETGVSLGLQRVWPAGLRQRGVAGGRRARVRVRGRRDRVVPLRGRLRLPRDAQLSGGSSGSG
jgi:hypothetical protein